MNLNRRRYLLLGGVLLLLLMLPIYMEPAYASPGGKKIEGSGTLHAVGAGIAILKGDGSVTVTGRGVGYVWIKGAETISAQGEGRKFEYHGGTLFIGWRGTVHASGCGIEVHIGGAFIKFTASGTGTAYLKGKGRYWVNGDLGEWTQ